MSKKRVPPTSRAAKIKGNGGTLLFPFVSPEAEYLLELWDRVGRAQSGGMGLTPLSSVELQAWQQVHGVVLSPFEAAVLQGLSREYTAQLSTAEKADCPPPYGDPVNTVDRDVVAKKMQDAFSALKQAKK